MIKTLLSLLIAGFLSSGAASASAILLDQSPGTNSDTELVSSTTDNFGAIPGFRVADNFSLASAATITDVHWWGESHSGGNSFTFTFYANNGGTPGAVLLATPGSLTMSTVLVGSGFDPVILYSSDLSVPFSASAGIPYWISIFNSAGDASWLWLVADASGDGSLLASNNAPTLWGNTGRDMAFQLSGQESHVPEPGSLLLLGTGGLGLIAAWRRRTGQRRPLPRPESIAP